MEFVIGLTVLLVRAGIFGVICGGIVGDKGYDENTCIKYAILGAIFGTIVLIVALLRQPCPVLHTYGGRSLGNSTSNEPVQPKEGYWICPRCKKNIPDYTGTCACGFDKYKAM